MSIAEGIFRKIGLTVVSLALFLVPLTGQGSRHYLFLSDQRIVTVELIAADEAILNYINLSQEFEVVQAPFLVLFDSEGNIYHGHLIQVENPSVPEERYQVSDLIGPGNLAGYTIVGDYRFRSPPRRAYFRVGSAILELEPLTEDAFERLAKRIGELDLSSGAGGVPRVRAAGFRRGYGVLRREGSKEATQWENYFPDLELLQPVLLANPLPRRPPSAAHLPDPVVVRIRALITRGGGVRDLRVSQGLNKKLDKIALETVRNRWRLLPAISKGEVVDSQLTLKVFFQR